jgi:hypothetical protein
MMTEPAMTPTPSLTPLPTFALGQRVVISILRIRATVIGRWEPQFGGKLHLAADDGHQYLVEEFAIEPVKVRRRRQKCTV